MFYRSTLVAIIMALFSLSLSGQESERNIMTGAISKQALSEMILDHDAFQPLPLKNDMFWETLDENTVDIIIAEGEKYLDYDWPSLLARRYMDFDIDGNRTRYSQRYYGRRNAVSDLCMAEIAENKGRFLDDIINGIWLILEETTWVVPAHSEGNKLHDINDVFVDLFSAETAALLGWVDYYLGEEFDNVTPLLRKRIYEEVNRRVIVSMLEHNDFWYMGYTDRIPNNWNPWIVSNWLTAVLLLEKDPETRTESVWKALDVLDNYLNPHPADGGCDEGPGYWGRAGASLFDCLFLLDKATGGNFNVYNNSLIRNMGTYIYKIHISDSWYVNFADGSARVIHEPGTMYRIGKSIDDANMMALAAQQFRKNPEAHRILSGRSPFGQRTIPDLMIMDELADFEQPFEPELNYIFPDLEVAVAREGEKGFFLTIKGGFNDESHNHNDVGSFVIFYDGMPLFIDVGVGTYTRKTFSNERYTIWTMQSAYHNLPSPNGVMQKDGHEFRARGFNTKIRGDRTTVNMDIAGAYPENAHTLSWNRNMTLDRPDEMITLTDAWKQSGQTGRNQWHFILATEPVILEEGEIMVTNGKTQLKFMHDEELYVQIEKINIDDNRLQRIWGKSLWRLTLTSEQKGLQGKETFIIKK
ncbi:MAG: heparinase II/III-family protein [Bacteroidales bacterium]|nr:heparinase II/III-family protein [Bacteroidales bacterium]